MASIREGWDGIGGSTTWEWRRVRIKPAAPQGGSATQSHDPASTVPARRRDAHTITVKYLGGPESCWLVRRGGRAWRAPGWMALEDLMNALGLTEL